MMLGLGIAAVFDLRLQWLRRRRYRRCSDRLRDTWADRRRLGLGGQRTTVNGHPRSRRGRAVEERQVLRV